MSIVVWWLLLTALGAAAVPFLPRLFPGFPDRGVAFARPLAVTLFALGAWLLGSLGLPYGIALLTMIFVFGVATATGLRRFGVPAISRVELLRAEATFALAYLFFAGVRALRPEIFGAEKYMDFAFFNAIVGTSAIPPEDPWLAGAPINYYYFGYLLFASLTRLSAIAPEIAYNLALATIGAVLFAGATSIGRALSGRFSFGLLGGLAAAVLGNLDGAQQIFVDGRSFAQLDYWRSSRVVPNTINEFPFFSLLHGDLHPHVTALFLEIPLAGLLLSARASRTAAVIAVPFLAAIALTNPWDLPLTFALLGLLQLRQTWRPREAPLGSLLPVAGVVVASAVGVVILSLPFARHFEAPLGGIGWVHTQTTLAAALVVFGILVLPNGLAIASRALDLLPAAADRRGLVLGVAGLVAAVLAIAAQSAVLAATALLLGGSLLVCLADTDERASGAVFVALGAIAVGACEIVYLRDPYGADLHRMNTVFKFYYQAWFHWALALPAMLAIVSDRLSEPIRKRTGIVALGTLIVAGLCYPVAAVITFSRTAPGLLELDGIAYLERDHPDDARAIRWLREHVRNRPRILEATGDPYSYFARVSSNTGLPTLLGWANHESVWRGTDPRVGERAALVRRIYDGTDVGTAASLLARHTVRYVFVGELERKTYAADGLAKFARDANAFAEVFRAGETAVYEVRVMSSSEP